MYECDINPKIGDPPYADRPEVEVKPNNGEPGCAQQRLRFLKCCSPHAPLWLPLHWQGSAEAMPTATTTKVRANGKQEGLLLGISAGANVWAAQQVAKAIGPGNTVVTILCDTGERYFSLAEYFQ